MCLSELMLCDVTEATDSVHSPSQMLARGPFRTLSEVQVRCPAPDYHAGQMLCSMWEGWWLQLLVCFIYLNKLTSPVTVVSIFELMQQTGSEASDVAVQDNGPTERVQWCHFPSCQRHRRSQSERAEMHLMIYWPSSFYHRLQEHN